MIKIYTTEVIGVDTDDHDRPLFKLRTFDECSATLTIDTVIWPGNIGQLFEAIQQALERLELDQP